MKSKRSGRTFCVFACQSAECNLGSRILRKSVTVCSSERLERHRFSEKTINDRKAGSELTSKRVETT